MRAILSEITLEEIRSKTRLKRLSAYKRDQFTDKNEQKLHDREALQKKQKRNYLISN